MTTRIADLSANNEVIRHLLRTQSRLHDLEVQVTTEKVSQDYLGLAKESQRLVNLENMQTALEDYVRNNETVNLRMGLIETSIEGIQTTISDFRDTLAEFTSGGQTDEQRVQDVQDFAFRSLKAMEGYLNVEVGGRFLFAGSRVDQQPVTLGLSTLAAFQQEYDGYTTTFPTTRDAHLMDFSISEDDNDVTSWLTFERDPGGTAGPGRITATTARFSNIEVGTTITVSGTSSNDGTYTVSAVDSAGMYIDITSEMLTDEAAAAAYFTELDATVITDSATTGTLTFSRANDTITAANAGTLSNIEVGDVVRVTGTGLNAGNYVVEANDYTTITVRALKLTDEGTVAAPHLSYTSAAAEVSFVDNAPNQDTIVAAAGSFTGLAAGMEVTISGATDAGNNATFTVASVSTDGSTITVEENVTARANDANAVTFLTQEAGGTITATRYYGGDEISTEHRLDDDRNFELDINAIDPAFEKAIRAMAIVAQGLFQSDGGLDQNYTRANDALNLIDRSLQSIVTGTPPYGTELSSNIESLQMELGFKQILVNDANEYHTQFIAFLEARVAETENVDVLEAVTKLLDDSNALEASYQTLARIQQLSLTDYI